MGERLEQNVSGSRQEVSGAGLCRGRVRAEGVTRARQVREKVAAAGQAEWW